LEAEGQPPFAFHFPSSCPPAFGIIRALVFPPSGLIKIHSIPHKFHQSQHFPFSHKNLSISYCRSFAFPLAFSGKFDEKAGMVNGGKKIIAGKLFTIMLAFICAGRIAGKNEENIQKMI